MAVAFVVAGLVTSARPVEADAATVANILVSTDNSVFEYTPDGVPIQQIPVPYPDGVRPTSERARDIVQDATGQLRVYNGTFNPFLSSYDLSTRGWDHRTHSGLSTVNNTSFGGIAAFGRFVFMSDMFTYGDGGADELSGIVRFDTIDGSSSRFSDGIDYIDLSVGLDGMLYGLLAGEATVRVYDPASLAFQRTVILSRNVRGIAVDPSGEIFGASWDGNLYRFSASGGLISTRSTGAFNLSDIDVASTGQLIAGGRFGDVIVSDTQLRPPTSFVVRPDETFVAFAAPANPVTIGVAGPPRELSATPQDQAALISWRAPYYGGGTQITGYTATATPGGASCTTTTSLSCVIPMLTNGVRYTVQVYATNAQGPGESSPPAPVTPRTVAAAPTIGTATSGVAEATVTWKAPSDDGGAPIDGYFVFPSPGAPVVSVAPTARSATVKGLENGVSYTFSVVALNAAGQSPHSAASPAVTPLAFTALPAPVRLLDSRNQPTVDGQLSNGGRLPAGATVEVPVAGRGGVAGNATTVGLNVTVVLPGSAGFVTVFPCGQIRPTASNLNFGVNDVIASAVIARVGNQGKVCIYTSASTHLVVDASGIFPPAAFTALPAPVRLADTRNQPTVDGQFSNRGPVPAGTVLELVGAGRGGLSSTTTSVSLNVTAVNPGQPGFVTVFPCGVTRPNASNLNFQAGQVIANSVITRVGTQGKVCLYTSASTHLIIDASGEFPPTAFEGLLPPARLLDTRNQLTVDGQFANLGRMAGATTLQLTVAGRGGLTGTAPSVALNVTVVGPEASGFVTIFPCGQTRPTASNLNFRAGEVIANATLAKVGTQGKVCLYTSTTTHLIVDAAGAV